MAIPQGFFLPRWEEEPLFPPTNVDRPAEGAENVGMERRPGAGGAHVDEAVVIHVQSIPVLVEPV